MKPETKTTEAAKATTRKRTEAERIAEREAYEAERIRAAELNTIGETATTRASKNKHAASGNKKIEAIQNGKKSDIITANAADLLSKAATMKAKAAKLTEEAKEHRRNARISPDKLIAQAAARGEAMTWEAAEAYKDSQTAEAKSKTREAASLEREAKRTEDSTTDRNFTDRRPIVNDSIIGYLLGVRIPTVITPEEMSKAAKHLEEVAEHRPGVCSLNNAAAVILHTPELLFLYAEAEHYQKLATTAAGAAESAELHHDTHRREVTTKTLATPEILEAWRAVHGENSGKAYKVYLDRDNANWHTMEYRVYKDEPTGWYLIHHHKTISPIVSLEAYAENSHRAEAEAAEHGAEALKAARAEAEEVTPEIITNGGIPFAETQEAAERIREAIIENTNFTKRERDFTAYFLSTKAEEAAQEAVNEAEAVKVRARRAEEAAKAAERTARVQKTPEAKKAAKAAKKAAKEARAEADKIQALTEEGELLKGTDLIRYRAKRHAAAAHVGIQTEDNEYQFIKRFKKHAAEVLKIEQGCPTPEEAAEAEAKDMERMQKNRHRRQYRAEAVTVLFVGIDTPEAIQAATAQIERKAKSKHATKADKARAERAAKATKATEATKAAPAIIWKDSGIAPQTMTPEEVEAMTARERAAHAAYINAHAADIARLDYRRQFTQYRQSRTAYAAHDAQAAALVFWDAMTPAEQTAHIEAERARKAKYTRLRAAAHATGVYSLNSTFEQWKAWSEEERAEHMRFVANFNK